MCLAAGMAGGNPGGIPFTGIAPSLIAPKQAKKVNDKIGEGIPLGMAMKFAKDKTSPFNSGVA